MTHQKDLKCKGNQNGVDDVIQEKEDTKKERVRFRIDSDEVLDDKERIHLQKDTKKYEPIVDQLFDGGQSQDSTEE